MKKILFLVVISIMMLAAHNSASAQETMVKNDYPFGENWVLFEESWVLSPDSCWNWLLDNPDAVIAFYSPSVVTEEGAKKLKPVFNVGDTVPDMLFIWYLKGDTLWREAKYHASVLDIPIQVIDAEVATAIDSIAATKQVEYKATATVNRRDDVLYYQTEGVAVKTDGIIPVKKLRKDGFSLFGEGVYTFCKGAGTHAFSGLLGIALTGERYRVSLGVGPSRNQYSPNAERAGQKYWGVESEAFGGVQLFKLDWLDQFRLFIGGSLNFNYFSTDSRPAEDGSIVRSKGNYLAAGVGAELSYRVHCKPIEFFARWVYQPKALVIQNQGHDRLDGWRASIGILCNIHR